MAPIVYAGTSGQGAWYSTDLGETWKRPLRGWAGMYLESRVWALAAHPQEPRFVYAGTETGIYRWDVNERLWTHLPSPMDTMQVWSLTMHPKNPAVLYAGTRPAALFRSSDAGRTWDRIGVEFSPTCEFIFHPRVTTLFFDPTDERTLWAGAEIDGVRRSTEDGPGRPATTDSRRSTFMVWPLSRTAPKPSSPLPTKGCSVVKITGHPGVTSV